MFSIMVPAWKKSPAAGNQRFSCTKYLLVPSSGLENERSRWNSSTSPDVHTLMSHLGVCNSLVDCLCLPSCGPGFESQAHHKCFTYQILYYICHCIGETMKMYNKMPGLDPIKILERKFYDTHFDWLINFFNQS